MKRLLLIGGGHAQLQVLAALADQPLPDVEVTLVSPCPRQIYSGMLPGWVAGIYRIEQCAIPIAELARRARVRFVESACSALDLESKEARCASGETIAFDIVSIDSGSVVDSVVDSGSAEGIAEHAIAIRPIEGFVAAWPALIERARVQDRGFTLAIVGDGAAGTELAFAVEQRFASERLPRARVVLVGSGCKPLAGLPARLRDAALTLFEQRAIVYLAQRRALSFRPGGVALSDGSELACDASLVLTGAAAPAWPAAAGLACDERGFIRLAPTLQSLSHPFVLAAGDVACYADARPKSGVFAVRAGPILADNLRALCTGRALRAWSPQRSALYLISTGRRHALAAWGPLCAQGDWIWRWKDRIDRRFVGRFW